MILLVTNKEDVTVDLVIMELQRRGREFFRLNTEDLPAARIAIEDQGSVSIEHNGRMLCSEVITCAYYRRPGRPDVAAYASDANDQLYGLGEYLTFLDYLYHSLEGKWLNSPGAIQDAENKPKQLRIARDLGFNVPRTLITNDSNAAQTFLKSHTSIAKPLKNARLNHGQLGDEIAFTTSLDNLSDNALDFAGLAIAPVIFQHQIEKQYDIRVTVVGGAVFATAIHSQVSDDTRIDWRKSSGTTLEHQSIHLPADIKGMCLTLTKRLGLSFGAIDLILDINGNYWFLEINPNGQWGWIEFRTGAKIAAAIVDILER